MKSLKYLALVLFVFITSTDFLSAQANFNKTSRSGIDICTVSGEILADFTKLLNAYNKVSRSNATSVNVNEIDGELRLFFYLNSNTATSYSLRKVNEVIAFASTSMGRKDSCKGNGCSSCKLESGTIFIPASCVCYEGEGSCDHTVTISSVITNPSDIIRNY